MEIFLSAGEASSDIHCAQLIGELKKRHPDLKTFGLGGEKLKAEGTRLLMHNREFSVGGGPGDILSKLPKRSRLERMVEAELFSSKRRPDCAILVDSGEINLRLAGLLHFFGVPVVYYIPPKVWVWRHSRIEKISQHVNLVLSILPFEESIYREWNIPFQYVGNPLIDEVDLTLTESAAKQKLGIDPGKSVVTVFPGSRYNEVKMHTAIFSDAIARFATMLPADQPKPSIVVPAAQAIDADELRKNFEAGLAGSGLDLHVVRGMSHEGLRAARAAIVKSGTSTLESALLGTPMVLAYGASRSSAWVYRHVVKYKGFVGLVNLFLAKSSDAALGWAEPEQPTVPELIVEKCRPELIAEELLRIYIDGQARTNMLTALGNTRALLLPKDGSPSPSAAAAKAVSKLLNK